MTSLRRLPRPSKHFSPDVHRLNVSSRQRAYIALAVLTLIWGMNWLAMKFALQRADPVSFNIQRTLLAIVVLFGAMLLRRVPLAPQSWIAIIVTGFLQTTLNFGSTTMAVAYGAPGRVSVLVFTMPFWTLLLAWPVFGERVRGGQWLAVLLALVGLTLVVEPWNWHEEIKPRLWAVLSGFGWASGTIATKYFQREKQLDMLNFIAWQMVAGIIPFLFVPLFRDAPPTRWDAAYIALLIYSGALCTAAGFLIWVAVLRVLPAGTAALNMLAIPAIALVSSMLVLGERLSVNDWLGIACIAGGLLTISLLAWRAARRSASDVTSVPVIESG
jgi:drug/metabolite transporter (DMT)-like permease